MLTKAFVARHITFVAILLFLTLFAVINMMKPSFLYNKDGSLRTMGVGWSRRTVVPAWLVSLIVASLCYLAVMFYVSN